MSCLVEALAKARHDDAIRAAEKHRLAAVVRRSRSAHSQRAPDRLKLALLAVGVYQVALGTLMLVAPGRFFEWFGPFGVQKRSLHPRCRHLHRGSGGGAALGSMAIALARYRDPRCAYPVRAAFR